MDGSKKRKAVYNPDADKRWREKNKERARYLTDRTSCRRFLRDKATKEDLEEMEQLIAERRQQLKNVPHVPLRCDTLVL